MNVAYPSPVIREGDLVILHINSQSLQAIKVNPKIKNKNGIFVDYCHQTKYGSFKVGSLVGKAFGSVLQLKDGFINLLHPSSELWTLSLPHRTQILYTTDISMVLLNLELSPGSIVCEAGTGSGSLSHAFMRTVAPTGQLFTFDFHEKRVETARQEFLEHGFLEPLVTVCHRDVCAEGFGLKNKVDAVFLDLPKPWDAVPHAATAFKTRGGRLCSFSPCIEQVQRTCAVLESLGFWEIRTVECLLREYLVRRMALPLIEPRAEEEGGPPRKGAKRKATHGAKLEEFRAVLPAVKATGHTGYLTFATFLPKEEDLKEEGAKGEDRKEEEDRKEGEDRKEEETKEVDKKFPEVMVTSVGATDVSVIVSAAVTTRSEADSSTSNVPDVIE